MVDVHASEKPAPFHLDCNRVAIKPSDQFGRLCAFRRDNLFASRHGLDEQVGIAMGDGRIEARPPVLDLPYNPRPLFQPMCAFQQVWAGSCVPLAEFSKSLERRHSEGTGKALCDRVLWRFARRRGRPGDKRAILGFQKSNSLERTGTLINKQLTRSLATPSLARDLLGRRRQRRDKIGGEVEHHAKRAGERLSMIHPANRRHALRSLRPFGPFSARRHKAREPAAARNFAVARG